MLKITNKISFFFILIFFIFFIYLIVSFPTQNNFICLSLSWFNILIGIKYLFWKNNKNISVFNEFTLSSIPILFFLLNYFINPLIAATVNSKPLDFNLLSGTLPFVFPTIVFFNFILIHWCYRKVKFFLTIKKKLTRLWENANFFYNPTLKELIITAIPVWFILFLLPKDNDSMSKHGAYLDMIKNPLFVFASLPWIKKYTFVYSKKTIWALYVLFFFSTVIIAIKTGIRKEIGMYFKSTQWVFLITTGLSVFFLKKNFHKTILFIILSSIFLPYFQDFVTTIRYNRYAPDDPYLASLQNRDPTDSVDFYVGEDSEYFSRGIMNKNLDNDHIFFYKLSPSLRNYVKELAFKGLITKGIPSLFFGSRDHKQDISSTYGSFLDMLRYYNLGIGIKSFISGSVIYEDFLIIPFPLFIFLFLTVIPIGFILLDSFVFLDKFHTIVFPVMLFPFLIDYSSRLFGASLLLTMRNMITSLITCLLIVVLFKISGKLLSTLGSGNKDKILLNSDYPVLK